MRNRNMLTKIEIKFLFCIQIFCLSSKFQFCFQFYFFSYVPNPVNSIVLLKIKSSSRKYSPIYYLNDDQMFTSAQRRLNLGKKCKMLNRKIQWRKVLNLVSNNRKTQGRKVMFKILWRKVHHLVSSNRKTQSRKTTKRCKIPHREMQGVIDHYCSVKSPNNKQRNFL